LFFEESKLNHHNIASRARQPSPQSEEASTAGTDRGLREFETKQSDSTQPNGTAQQVLAKAVFTQIAELALAGHAVHELPAGAFMVTKYGLVKHCENSDELQVFARKLGVSK
jgi:hypothetical protein